ncbi:uncharacterized protein LOC144948305 [Lampetra fluviatilis]
MMMRERRRLQIYSSSSRHRQGRDRTHDLLRTRRGSQHLIRVGIEPTTSCVPGEVVNISSGSGSNPRPPAYQARWSTSHQGWDRTHDLLRTRRGGQHLIRVEIEPTTSCVPGEVVNISSGSGSNPRPPAYQARWSTSHQGRDRTHDLLRTRRGGQHLIRVGIEPTTSCVPGEVVNISSGSRSNPRPPAYQARWSTSHQGRDRTHDLLRTRRGGQHLIRVGIEPTTSCVPGEVVNISSGSGSNPRPPAYQARWSTSHQGRDRTHDLLRTRRGSQHLIRVGIEPTTSCVPGEVVNISSGSRSNPRPPAYQARWSTSHQGRDRTHDLLRTRRGGQHLIRVGIEPTTSCVPGEVVNISSGSGSNPRPPAYQARWSTSHQGRDRTHDLLRTRRGGQHLIRVGIEPTTSCAPGEVVNISSGSGSKSARMAVDAIV